MSWQKAYNEGYSKGEAAGYADGYSAGEASGYSDGYDEGRIDGYDEGRIDGCESVFDAFGFFYSDYVTAFDPYNSSDRYPAGGTYLSKDECL